nr:MAG TPA: hypothetical protein [Caudoviricetes sp.]
MALGPAKGHPVDEPGRPCGQRGKGSFVQRAADGCILVIGAVIQKNQLLLGSPVRGAGCRRQTERFGHAFFLMRMVWGLVTLKA